MICRLPQKTAAGVGQPSSYVVQLEGIYDRSYAYVTINGTQYPSNMGATAGQYSETVTIAPGTSIAVYVSSNISGLRSGCSVAVNGTVVKSGYGTYNYTPHSDIKLYMVEGIGETSGGQSGNFYSAGITTM